MAKQRPVSHKPLPCAFKPATASPCLGRQFAETPACQGADRRDRSDKVSLHSCTEYTQAPGAPGGNPLTTSFQGKAGFPTSIHSLVSEETACGLRPACTDAAFQRN
jgi:hypothetical protein